MLRTLALTVTTLAVLAAAPVAHAQGTERRQFGIGVGANASFDETTGASPYEIYVPIRLGPTFRIEPSFGLITADGGGGDFSDITLGIGAFAVRRAGAPFDLYYGGRLKLGFRSAEFGPGEDDSTTDFYLSGALGGEYFVVPQFSLGLEANLGFYQLGDLGEDDQSGLFTTGLFFLRMYL